MVDLNKKTVTLAKSQCVNLSKDYDGLNAVQIGLGWDPAASEKASGFFKRLLGATKSSYSIDLDAWVQCFSGNTPKKRVFFGNKVFNADNGDVVIRHHGDNLTGEGDGDDEVITLYLAQLPPEIDKVFVSVSIYNGESKQQSFNNIKNTFIRLVDTRDNFELCRYTEMSSKNKELTFVAGEFIKENNEWQFRAVGKYIQASSMNRAAEQLVDLI